MADKVYRQFYDDPYISAIAAFLQTGAIVDTVLQGIKDAMAGTNLVAQSNVSLRSGVFTIFERAFSIT